MCDSGMLAPCFRLRSGLNLAQLMGYLSPQGKSSGHVAGLASAGSTRWEWWSQLSQVPTGYPFSLQSGSSLSS